MLFAIHAIDHITALPTRLATYDAHKAFLRDTSRFGLKIVMSGPLVDDDGATMIGSLFLIDAAGRAEVEAFNRADPLRRPASGRRSRSRGFCGGRVDR